jgi:hypothetical protein
MKLDIENDSGNMIAAQIIGAGYHDGSKILTAARKYENCCEWAMDNVKNDSERCASLDDAEFELFSEIERLGFDKEHDINTPVRNNYAPPFIKVTIPNSQFLSLVCELSELATGEIDTCSEERTVLEQDAINVSIDDATQILANHGITDAGI